MRLRWFHLTADPYMEGLRTLALIREYTQRNELDEVLRLLLPVSEREQ